MKEEALKGLKVIEFGEMVSAPYCTKLMADLGAEVIKVERPGLGDKARRTEPFAGDVPGIERSGLFAYLNTNKLSVTINTSTKKGRALFRELVAYGDVLVENNHPKTMEKLGFTYESLKEVNPRIIMTSITPFGQSGPYRNYRAYELNTYHGGGFGYISTVTFKEPVMPPIKAGGRQSEFAGAMAGAVATMCAIFAREATGSGQHIDISIQECLAGQYESAIEHWTFNENEMGGLTNPIIQPMLPIPCQDGWVFLMCVEEQEFDNLVKVMGNPEWVNSELFKDRYKRAEYADALSLFLYEWSSQYKKEELFRICQEGGVPVGPAYTAEDVINSEHLRARNYFVEIDHPVIGRTKYPGAPYFLSETPWKAGRAPLLGEHNEEVFCGKLGYTRIDLVKFMDADII
jgi:crotonobetainyl-CoA:carnitine CoA-transferase CaiB-like acyl-CoA transferase